MAVSVNVNSKVCAIFLILFALSFSFSVNALNRVNTVPVANDIIMIKGGNDLLSLSPPLTRYSLTYYFSMSGSLGSTEIKVVIDKVLYTNTETGQTTGEVRTSKNSEESFPLTVTANGDKYFTQNITTYFDTKLVCYADRGKYFIYGHFEAMNGTDWEDNQNNFELMAVSSGAESHFPIKWKSIEWNGGAICGYQ